MNNRLRYIEEQKGHPVNLAIDCLGGKMLGKCLQYVASSRRWIQIATLAGDTSKDDFINIYVKNIKIIGSTLKIITPQEKGEILNGLVNNIWPKIVSGEVKIKIHKALHIETLTMHKAYCIVVKT